MGVWKADGGLTMKMLRNQKYLFALLGLLLVFAACKGESPTAPAPTGGGGTTPGGSTPATGTVITLTVSNASPLQGSTSTVIATVTQNGQLVPNGTAVEFATNLGTFTDTNAQQSTIRTTTNGVATATVSSDTAGTATVTATINNVSKSTTITFRAPQTTPTPPSTAPTITSINPNFGLPSGGQLVTITGTNFRQPLRVLFDFGANTAPIEATVVQATPTSITVVTPRIDLGTGQTKQATIIVIVDAGSPNESRATSSAFTYVAEQLTPSVTILSPSNGPINGGTRVTIFGDAFQAPVSVQFGSDAGNFWQDAQIVRVEFKQIIVITPDGRSTSVGGGSTVTGPVDLRVTNINSAKSATVIHAFRYTPAMQITAIHPTFGSAIGGTEVTIDGVGFDDPVTVAVVVGTATVQAQPLRVSGTQILARMGPLPSPCAAASGPIIVTRVEDGGTAPSTENFTYVPVSPTLVSITPASGPDLIPGQGATIVVRDPGVGPLGTASIRFVIGGVSVTPTPSTITQGTGTLTFSAVIPTNLTFPTVACTTGGGTAGTQFGPGTFDIVFNNVTTACTDRLVGVVIQPPTNNPCIVNPPVASVGAPSPACPTGPSVNVASGTGTINITVANTAAVGSQSLNVTPSVLTNAAEFTAVTPSGQQTIAPGSSLSFAVTFDPNTPGQRTGTIRFATNDPARPTVDVPVCGTGTAPPVAAVSLANPPCPAGPSIAVGNSGSISITVQNTAPAGAANLTVTATIFSNPTDFPTVAPTGAQTIPPGGSLPFTVTFTPSSLGVKNGTVRFTTNDPTQPVIDRAVCGTGT